MKEKIDRYREEKSLLSKIIVIYGPTGCGKTLLSLEVAKYLRDLHLSILPASYSPFIVSVDSRQIYRHMDIGTGKILPHEMAGIQHFGLDLVNPDVTFSMVDFRNAIESLPIWQEWLNSGDIQSSISNTTQEIDSFVPRNDSNIEFSISSKLSPNLPRFQDSKLFPILCGGTGLYIDGLIYNMEYPDTPPDWEYREALERIRIHEGNQILWNMLEVVDPDYAHELNVNNFRYVMRGLEVIRATGKSKRESHGKKKPRFSPLFLTPYVDNDRGELYTRIDKRVELMFKNGLLEETEYLMNNFNSSCPGLATIGYKEVVDHLEGHISLEESIGLVQQHSRNYAKRQITWNKRYD